MSREVSREGEEDNEIARMKVVIEAQRMALHHWRKEFDALSAQYNRVSGWLADAMGGLYTLSKMAHKMKGKTDAEIRDLGLADKAREKIGVGFMLCGEEGWKDPVSKEIQHE